VVSQVGDDGLGKKAVAALRGHGLEARHLGRSREYPTGTVRIELGPASCPRLEIAERAAWDPIPWSEDLAGLARRADAVDFGTPAQRGDTSREMMLPDRPFTIRVEGFSSAHTPRPNPRI
jgi:fructokinase